MYLAVCGEIHTFAVVCSRKGHLKVTEMVNEVKSTSRGEKCLAKFIASNGNVYGSLTLDIRKAGDYSQPLPVAVRVCHAGQKVFLRLGKTYTMEEWLTLCEYEKKWSSCSTDREKRYEKSNGQGGTYCQSTYRRKQLLSS